MNDFDQVRQRIASNASAEEKYFLEKATDPQALLADVRHLNNIHADQSRLRRFADKLNPFLKGIERFEKALDVLMATKPESLAPLWGSARIFIRIAQDLHGVFDKISERLRRLGRQLSLFETFSSLYPDSEALINAV